MPGGSLRGFAEKVVLVACGTAGAHRLGRAVAIQLALEGAYVIVSHAPDDAAGRRTISELREMGTLAHAIECDGRDALDIKRSFEQVASIYGRLDLLAHVTSVEASESLTEATASGIDEAFGASLRSSVLHTRYASEMLARRGAGAIVNVLAASTRTSLTEALSVNEDSSFAIQRMIEGGLVELTRGAATELARLRVRVNMVKQGRASEKKRRETGGASVEDMREFARTFQADKGLEEFLNRTISAADEVGRAVLYLLSPEAKFVSGQVLTVGE